MSVVECITQINKSPQGTNTWLPIIRKDIQEAKYSGKMLHGDYFFSIVNATVFDENHCLYFKSQWEDIAQILSEVIRYSEPSNRHDINSNVMRIYLTPGDIIKERGYASTVSLSPEILNQVYREFIGSILDNYVPSDFIDDVIDAIISINPSDPFKTIMNDYSNDSFFYDNQLSKIVGDENDYYVKSVKTSVKKAIMYIHDILSFPESAADASRKFYCDVKEARSYRHLITYTSKYPMLEGNHEVMLNEVIIQLENNPEGYKGAIASHIRSLYAEKLNDGTFVKYLRSFYTGILERVLPTMISSGKIHLNDRIVNIANEIVDEAVDFDETMESFLEDDIVMEGADEVKQKITVKVNDTKNKVSNAWKKYKNGEDAVDNQLTKMISLVKTKFIGDTKVELIEGKKFSVISILKKALLSAAVFKWSKIGALALLCVQKTMQKKSRKSERLKLKMELEEEIEILAEKIQDASADGDREAKYAMMRTKKELENALVRLKSGMEMDDKAIKVSKDVVMSNRKG